MASQQPRTVIRLPARSRYRSTPIYSALGVETTSGAVVRRTFFGTWERPEIKETRQPIVYTVRVEEEGNPHLIAFRVYGDKTLWWAFCVRNAIRFPLTELVPGKRLVCPHLDDVVSALSSG